MTPLLATVILDPTTAMVGGAALALFSTQLIRKTPELELKRTALLGAGWGLYYGLTVSYMYFNYTDWMLVYLVDAKTISIPLTWALFMVILVLHGYLAALGVGALVMHGRLGLGIAVGAGVGITNLVLMALQGHAYNHVGTYAEYHAGTAPELAQAPAAQMAMTIAGALAAPGAILAIALRFIAGRKASRAVAPAQNVGATA